MPPQPAGPGGWVDDSDQSNSDAKQLPKSVVLGKDGKPLVPRSTSLFRTEVKPLRMPALTMFPDKVPNVYVNGLLDRYD